MPSSNKVSVGIFALISVLAVTQGTNSVLAWDDQYLARRDSITDGVGNSVASNIAIHTIDPWPPYVANDRINVDGHRIQLGFKRYQANRSIKPQGLGTSNIQFNSTNLGGASQGDASGGEQSSNSDNK
jgi:hypothetical protein